MSITIPKYPGYLIIRTYTYILQSHRRLRLTPYRWKKHDENFASLLLGIDIDLYLGSGNLSFLKIGFRV
jgi:hypothetical protein